MGAAPTAAQIAQAASQVAALTASAQAQAQAQAAGQAAALNAAMIAAQARNAAAHCVDLPTWQAAKIACAQKMAVKGIGAAAYVLPPAPLLNTAPQVSATDPNDPCVIAAKTPCSPTTPSYVATATAPPMQSVGPVTVQASSAQGFQHWGLLAAVAAGAAVLYVATRHP